jgi:hypothetical protein
MYGPNGNEDRVNHIQKLPATAQVLCISGDKDEFINKHVPAGKEKGNFTQPQPQTYGKSCCFGLVGKALWDTVIAGLACSSTTTLNMMAKGTHGVYPSAKGQKNDCTHQLMKWIKAFKAAQCQ